MSENFFSKLNAGTENRFWINNPTAEEIRLALDHGAVACTTNPAYCSRLIGVEKEYLHSLIDDAVDQVGDIDKAAILVYQRASLRIMKAFLPLYEKESGSAGFVTMQHDPRTDDDTEATIEAMQDNRALAPNFMAKIPVIKGGIEAIEFCVEENIPICATEVFGISQARAICERYEAAARRTKHRPPMYVTHITGIFDEYIKKLVARQGIDISDEVLAWAGLSIARKEFTMLRDSGYSVTMMGGGARESYHFTGLVGGPVHVTIGWKTAEEIMASGISPSSTLDKTTPKEVIDELREKLPDFRKAYDDDGLLPGEFAGYGPVQLFRNAFLKGWYLLLAEVATRKHARAI